VGVAILWLWAVDKVRPTPSDWIGVAVCLLGMAIIMAGSRPAAESPTAAADAAAPPPSSSSQP
jgi:hypothetical protein